MPRTNLLCTFPITAHDPHAVDADYSDYDDLVMFGEQITNAL